MTHVTKRLEMGYPQGSRLGLNLWKSSVDSLLHSFEDEMEAFKNYAYADDLVITTKGSSRQMTEHRLHDALSVVNRWATTDKLASI